MKRKKVWRYYCDFCGKGGCAGGHIASHERGCTANPNRVCGICDTAGFHQQSMPELVRALGDGTDLATLRDLTDNCPACILAAIRQSGVQKPWGGNDDPGFSVEFTFKQELEEFWKNHTDAMLERDGYWNI